MHERMTNVAVGITRPSGPSVESGLKSARCSRRASCPSQDHIGPVYVRSQAIALHFPTGELEANRKLRCQPIAVCHDDQNVLVRLVQIE